MKIIILSIALFVALQGGEQCDTLLEQSMVVTDSCLNELETNQEEIARARLFSERKIVAIMDTNNFLSEENQKINGKNIELVIENKSLKSENKKLKVNLSIAKNEISDIRLEMQNQIERLSSIQSKKLNGSKKINIMDSSIEVIPVDFTRVKKTELKSSAIRKTRNKILHAHSKELNRSYGKLSDEALLEKGIYRVPVYMLNVRYGHSLKYSIASILKRGELVEYNQILVKGSKSKKFVWLRINNGWMYVPSRKDTKFLVSMQSDDNNNSNEKVVMLYQLEGGSKG